MKRISSNKTFKKHYKKRIAVNAKLSEQFDQRSNIFVSGERGYPLDDHALTGNLAGKRAFSITSNIRVVYEESDDYIIFIDVGTHNQVYGNRPVGQR